jgi:large subunit ribosomal protein L3
MTAILGRKLGMTQVFNEKGEIQPVTVIEAGPCLITQVKRVSTDGYDAIQVGFGESKRLNKPERGHVKGVGSPEVLREFRVDDTSTYEVGARLDASLFAKGDDVDIIGTSKGHGFAGVVRRHGFHGGPKTHGQSDRHRSPGSIGASTTPGRVIKGMRMAGRMGGEQVTVRNLQVVQADGQRNLLLVRGAVPGARNGLLIITKAK